MKIAMIGFGTMGRLISEIAVEKGHSIAVRIDRPEADLVDRLRGCDVAIDFTEAAAVPANIEACLAAGVPLVEGTTGWDADREKLIAMIRNRSGSMVYGSNFSTGVNLFFRIADFAAELIAKFPEYETFIEERHHSRKKDAPSGTAIKLKNIIGAHYAADLPVSATRAGDIPGTHTVGFDSAPDTIELTHTARSREGFARGAILAAEWIVGKTGVFEFSEVMDEIVAR